MLLVGYGSVGRRHASNLESARGVRLGIAEPDGVARSSAATRHPRASLFASLEEGLRWEPDGVAICTPSHLHADMVRQALEHTQHVFVEKPLAIERDAATSLRGPAKGARVTVGYNWRYSRGFEAVREAVRSGRLGAPIDFLSYAASYLPAWREKDHRAYYSARAAEGGGVLLDFSHETNYLAALFEAPGAVTCSLRNSGTLGIDAEEVADIAWSSDRVSGLCHFDYLSRARRRTLRVLFERGVLEWDLEHGRVAVEDGSGTPPLVEGETVEETYVREIDSFLRVLRGGDGSPTDLEDSIRTLAVIEACRRADQTKAHVRVEFP